MARKTGITSERCSVCAHPERTAIDHNLAVGATFTATAQRFGLSHDAVRRHFQSHVSDAFKTAIKASAFGSEEALRKFVSDGQLGSLETLQALRGILTSRILAAAETGDDAKLATLISRAHQNVEISSRIIGDAAPSRSEVQISVADDPRVQSLVNGILGLVRKHPAIRGDVTALVRSVFQKDGGLPLLNVTPGADNAHA